MNSTHRIPGIFKAFPEVIAAESLRHGGVSPAPYRSLNLSWHTNDTDENVEENRRRFFQNLNISPQEVAGSFQVHKDAVLKVGQAGQYKGYDALITDRPNIFLTITVADCVPILIFDAEQNAVGAAHAGWKGSVAEIGRKTLQAMQRHYGARPESCFVFIGASIDYDSFEVDNDVAQHFSSAFKKWDENRGKFFVDLKKFNRVLMEKAGVPPQQIEVSPFSTVKNNDDYFSHRKEKGKTGRALGLIGIRN